MKLNKYLTDSSWAGGYQGKSDLENLGYMNSWHNGVPEIVKKCSAKNHKLTYSVIGRSELEYKCPICKFTYMVDSGD